MQISLKILDLYYVPGLDFEIPDIKMTQFQGLHAVLSPYAHKHAGTLCDLREVENDDTKAA